MHPEHPAAVHRRSIALVRHAARHDHVAYSAVLADVIGPEAAGAQMVSLCQVAGLLLSQIPPPLREQLLDEAQLALAQAEDVR